ncbi:MAG: hypothetical protein RLZZ490_2061 [Cyanobacteriota bacterium]
MSSFTVPPLPPLRLAIISSPRSGNTWLRHLLKTAYQLEERAAHTPEVLFEPVIPPRVVMQIHWLPDRQFCQRLEQEQIKTITLARHPLDLLLSILHFIHHEPTTVNWLEGAGQIDFSLVGKSPNSPEFINYATGDGAKALLAVSQHWWYQPNNIKIHYEALVKDTSFYFQQLLETIGQKPALSVAKTLELNQISKFKATPNHHAWQGKPGLWRYLLTASTALAIYEAHQAAFSTLGYYCTPDLALTPAIADERWQALRIAP